VTVAQLRPLPEFHLGSVQADQKTEARYLPRIHSDDAPDWLRYSGMWGNPDAEDGGTPRGPGFQAPTLPQTTNVADFGLRWRDPWRWESEYLEAERPTWGGVLEEGRLEIHGNSGADRVSAEFVSAAGGTVWEVSLPPVHWTEDLFGRDFVVYDESETQSPHTRRNPHPVRISTVELHSSGGNDRLSVSLGSHDVQLLVNGGPGYDALRPHSDNGVIDLAGRSSVILRSIEGIDLRDVSKDVLSISESRVLRMNNQNTVTVRGDWFLDRVRLDGVWVEQSRSWPGGFRTFVSGPATLRIQVGIIVDFVAAYVPPRMPSRFYADWPRAGWSRGRAMSEAMVAYTLSQIAGQFPREQEATSDASSMWARIISRRVGTWHNFVAGTLRTSFLKREYIPSGTVAIVDRNDLDGLSAVRESVDIIFSHR